MVAEGKEKQCRVCHRGFGASAWKYPECTDCAHYFCSSYCKDLWPRADDVDEEDPISVPKDEEAPVDPSELPFSHGDDASVVSSVAPSAAAQGEWRRRGPGALDPFIGGKEEVLNMRCSTKTTQAGGRRMRPKGRKWRALTRNVYI